MPTVRATLSVRDRVVLAAAELFMKQGFSNTSVKEISIESGVSENSIYYEMKTKEAIIAELIGYVIERQREIAVEKLKGITDDKLFMYCFEKVLQLYIAEINENIRELYTTVYSIPKTWDYIKEVNAEALKRVFGDRFPELDFKDFYELEIATGGIMRGYLTVPCNMYFTKKQKAKRYIETTLRIFNIDEETINSVFKFIIQFDFSKIANDTVNDLYNYFERRIYEKNGHRND
ncbi:MAG: TetR/AcrR family transcriptional regulator [Clostridia bacterium]|nr:TetR/AcrR family transcriptional regulator [Clostridia bacterium]